MMGEGRKDADEMRAGEGERRGGFSKSFDGSCVHRGVVESCFSDKPCEASCYPQIPAMNHNLIQLAFELAKIVIKVNLTPLLRLSCRGRQENEGRGMRRSGSDAELIFEDARWQSSKSLTSSYFLFVAKFSSW